MRINFIQNLIDKIRNKPNFTKQLVYKIEGYNKAENVSRIILGSSHLANGYYAVEGEYNLAMPSQDLYTAYELYKRLNRPDIKQVIIAISAFTPGLSTIKTISADFCVSYKCLLGIDYQYEEDAKEKNLYSKEVSCCQEIAEYKNNLTIGSDTHGNLLRYPHRNFNNKKLKERALKHFKNNQREISQLPYCEKILEIAKSNNQKVFFVIPPVTKSYVNAIPNKDILFIKLKEIVEKWDNAEIFNFFEAEGFDEKTDFTDEDHLNKNGAVKFANLVRGLVNN